MTDDARDIQPPEAPAHAKPAAKRTKRKRRWKLLGIALLVAFLAAELVSTFVMRNVARSPLIYTEDAHTSFALLPSTVETHASPSTLR